MKAPKGFSSIADSFAAHFERIFHCSYPCDRDSNETLQEANLTTNLLRALCGAEPNVFTWDEFPVPSETNINPNSKSKNRIDSVVIDSSKKTITMIEAKCLKRVEKRNTIPCQSIANDIARMINVANHRAVFPNRLWKNDGLKEKPIPIWNEYNGYSTFGIAACGVWWTGKKQTRHSIESLFEKGILVALTNIYAQRPDLQNKVDNGKIEVREIALPNILLKRRRWQYFVILYKFRVRKGVVDYRGTTSI